MGKVISIESVEETALYKELVRRNNSDAKAFVANIIGLCDEASSRSTQIPKFFSEYTLHDKTHFIRVTELMCYVLGNKLEQLNDIEIGLLILAAFYHDQGMLIEDLELSQLEKNDDYIVFKDNWIIDHSNYTEIKEQIESTNTSTEEKIKLGKAISQLETAMLTDFLRESHGQRGHDYILKKLTSDQRLSINGINISEYLAKICLSHAKSVNWITSENGLNYDENIGTDKVNTVFLAIVLRLADILDFDSDRTPDVLFKSIHFTNNVSVIEWQKHRSVGGWEISKDLVRFTMFFDHPVYEKTANVFLDWIDDELKNSHSLMRKFPTNVSKYQLEIAEKVDRSRLGPKNKAYIYHDLEFNLSRDEIVKLLMTDNLYKSKSLFVRELLQNSLDALRLRKAVYQKDNFEWNSGEVIFKHYIDIDGQHIVECTDNGCGMDEEIVTKFLGKVGRSFYRSPEFERQKNQLKEKGVDFEPCSQFGIGFMSCFMVGDRIQILTRKDYGSGKENGKPLIIDINGLGGLIMIKEGDPKQEIGTKVRVFERERPLLFDNWSDNIKLLTTLKGYALATEFPIKAICNIEGIKGEIIIPSSIDKKITFLERFNFKNCKTYEVDLANVNKNLRGFLRQTFLVDENNLPCVENNEAKWQVVLNKNTFNNQNKSEMTILNKQSNTSVPYKDLNHFGREHSICLDGILVCGNPGRSDDSHNEMIMLGHIGAKVSCEHPFTIDVRGSIKPELSPAREPLEKGSGLDLPFGWRNLQRLVKRGSGLLWEQILNLTDEGLTADTFWKLIIIYVGHPNSINSNSIFQKLKLPIENDKWIKISEIDSFFIDNESIVARDRSAKNHVISFSNDIKSLGVTYSNGIDFNYWMTHFLICLSKFEFKDGKPYFSIRKNFNEFETPSSVSIVRDFTSHRFIEFNGFSIDYISTTKHSCILNIANPLVKIAFDSKNVKRKNDLQLFAYAFVFNISYMIKSFNDDKKVFTTDIKNYPLKYTAKLFQRIDWIKYTNALKPPYKIFIDDDNTVEITEAVFEQWSKANVGR